MQEETIDPSTSGTIPSGGIQSNWRLFFKTVIKVGLVFGRNVQALGQIVYSETKKVVGEATTELDSEERAKASRTNVGGSH